MTDRDDLAALILPHLGHTPGTIGAVWAEQQAGRIADDVLAAGWRKTDEVGHNRWTPDVMPDGECPACDRIAQEVLGEPIVAKPDGYIDGRAYYW